MSDESFFTTNKYVKELEPQDFRPDKSYLLKDKSCWAVFFYCAWCPHCVSAKSEWENFAKQAFTFINVGAFNCEKNKYHINKIKEDKPDFIPGYPTFVIYSKGVYCKYNGKRTAADFLSKSMGICKTGQCS